MDQDVILRLLPEVMRETRATSPVLDALTATMARHHDRPEQILDDLDLYFRPWASPDRFLPALASWVDLDWVLTGEQQAGREPFGPGTDRLRSLIANVRELSSWRGTATGLQRFLELATGIAGFVVRSSAEQPFHVEVVAPAAARPHLALVERIVIEQKPVATTHRVTVLDAPAAVEDEASG